MQRSMPPHFIYFPPLRSGTSPLDNYKSSTAVSMNLKDRKSTTKPPLSFSKISFCWGFLSVPPEKFICPSSQRMWGLNYTNNTTNVVLVLNGPFTYVLRIFQLYFQVELAQDRKEIRMKNVPGKKSKILLLQDVSLTFQRVTVAETTFLIC